MANIVSYVDIIEIMTDIASRHYQINTFFLGKNWELENNKDLVYPVLQVFPEFAKMPINDWKEYKTLELSLNCKVIDLTTPGEENEKDVHSDTLRIAQDIVNELNQHPFYIRSNVSLMEDISFTAIEEFKDDISAGWQFTLKLKIINANTFCGMPIVELPGYSANGPTSSGLVVNTQYLTCDTLPACPTIVTIENTLGDLQDQIDNIPVGGNETLAQTLALGNDTGNISITSPDAFSFVNIFDGYFSVGYDNVGIGGYIRGNATEVLIQYASATTGGLLDITDAHTLVNHDVLIDIIAPIINQGNGTTINTLFGNVKINGATANTLAYYDGSKYLKSITLGAGLSLVSGTLSATTPTLSGTAPIVYSAGTISITQSTTSTNGYLSSTDWNTFNNKQAALSGTGLVKSTAGVISYDTNTYITATALTGYVPYTGATSNVVLGANTLSAQSVTVTGTAGAGHVHLRHQSVDPTAGANNTAIFADVNGDIKYKNDSLYYTTFKTSLNTADRVYTYQDASGTIAFVSDLSAYEPTANKQNSLVVDGTGAKFPTVDAVNQRFADDMSFDLAMNYIFSSGLMRY